MGTLSTNYTHDGDEASQLYYDDDEESQLRSSCVYEGENGTNPSQLFPSDGNISRFRPPSPLQLPTFITIQERIDHANVNHRQQLPTAINSITPSITSDDILAAGLSYAGFDLDRQRRNNLDRKTDWFKAFYGVEQYTVAPFFADIKNAYPDIVYKDCLMTMNWLNLYETYPVLSGRWKYCEEYIGSKVLDYAEKMAVVARKKIVFDLKHGIEGGRSLDCSTFMVQEFRLDPSSKWFDYKTHSCGVKYEFCLAIREPRVVWISGPHAASVHDITVFRGGDANCQEDWNQDALYFQLEEGEKCIADSGYAGEPGKIVVTKDEHSPDFKEFMARVKNRQETFHWRLKSFNILGHR
ncbi:hypothetical protein ACHAXR_006065, partial [Thalassiosira sp. AJA248-18]